MSSVRAVIAQAPAMPTIAATSVANTASLAFTNAVPTTVTVTLANLGLKNWKMNYVKSDSVVSWTLDFIGVTNATCLTIA
jgi:hypothetical protein